MEPSTAGIMAVPAIIGPQVPKSKWPIKAPIQPRNIFPKHPIRSPRLVRVPAKIPLGDRRTYFLTYYLLNLPNLRYERVVHVSHPHGYHRYPFG